MSGPVFHNTLTGKKEPFEPIEPGRVKMYTCGPTVYDLAHIGNFRAYVFEDLLHRFLLYRGYEVFRVMNITDVDDKTIAGARRAGVSLREFTERYTEEFLADMKTLRLVPPDVMPRATDHIPEMVALIRTLLEKGVAYRSEDGIYFRISAFPDYGKLSHLDRCGIKPGARVAVDEYSKEDVRDFVLWKASSPDEPSWDTEIGTGRPGWHIECSAMSMKYLGESFDIHCGGVDNIFPHHENEIAQSEAATGVPFVRMWLHCAHLLVNNEKMAKSKGNFYTLRDVLGKGYRPAAVRYLLMTTHYRDPLNFTEAGLAQASRTVARYNDCYRNLAHASGSQPNPDLLERIETARRQFAACLDDDLNISAAMAEVFLLQREANSALGAGRISPTEGDALRAFFEEVDRVLAILEPAEETLPEEAADLIRRRDLARRAKDYARADEIRQRLLGMGIVVEDTPQGTRWKKV